MKTLNTHIANIPCVVKYEVHGQYLPGTRELPAEYPEVEYYIKDRNGHDAVWLENKMTAFDEERIQQECLKEAGY